MSSRLYCGMPDNSAYLAFLRDPDQEVRRAELRDFFGPHADTFLRMYDSLREDAVSGKTKFRLFGGGFEIAAFFLGPVWFFYRKMWLMAWVIIGLMFAVSFIPRTGPIGIIFGVVLATTAHRAYVQHAIQKLTKLHATQQEVTPAQVQAAGGVSKAAGIVSGSILIGLSLIGILSTIYLAKHGIPPGGVRPR